MDSTLLKDLQSLLGGDFEIARELGGGGMSRVFLAREIRLGRDVVIKVLPPDLAAGIKAERFEREIHLSARLQHPHIVPVLTAGAGNGLLYYTMPFVTGPSLATRLKDGNPISLVAATRILRDVAEALSHAHSEGVVHRDVKPQNILLQSQHAVVLDFGVAKAIREAVEDTSLTSTGLTLGTPLYMAPEQALADPDVDHRADIYSLGVVAYEILAGRPPFIAKSPQAVMAAQITGSPIPLREINGAIPAPLESVVMRCLEKAPDARWQSAEELCEAFNDLGARFTPSGKFTPSQAPALQLQTSEGIALRVNPFTGFGKSRRSRFIASAVALTLALSFISGTVIYRRAATSDRPLSLAVMPFVNASGDEVGYFVDGMTEEVITSLVKVNGLNVASAASSFALGESTHEPRELGRRVGARYVLQGTVRRQADQLRITAHLVHVANGSYAWSNSYDATMGQIFEVQARISRDIAEALASRLVLKPGQRLENQAPTAVAAYELYLKGNAAARKYSEDDLKEAIDHYRAALRLEPRYARAYAGIASAYYNLADDFWPPRKAYPLVKENALKAIKLDSGLADAHASLASYEVSYGWNWENARRSAEKAVALNPNSSFAHLMLAWYNVIADRTSDAISEAKTASVLDPYFYDVGASVIALMRAAGRHDLAIQEARRMMRAGVGDTTVLRALMSWELMLSGDQTSARSQLDSALARSPQCCLRTKALYYAHTGNDLEARKNLDAFVDAKRANGLYYRADWIAEVKAALGDRNGTFTALEQAFKDRSLGIPTFTRNPELRRFEADSLFLDLARRLSLPRSSSSRSPTGISATP